MGKQPGVRIPRSVAAAARLQAGASVEIAPVAETIVIRPVKPARYRLSDLLKGIKRSNLHGAVDSGGPLGRESF